MRTHILICLLCAFAIIGAVFWSPTVEMPAEAGHIDFANLNSQATSAMQQLQVSQERRMALLLTDEL
jgi:hypothetical protein